VARVGVVVVPLEQKTLLGKKRESF